MSAESIGTIALNLVLNNTGFHKSLNGVFSKAKNLSAMFNKDVGGSLNNMTGMAKKAGMALAGAFAASKIYDFGKSCVELGSDLAEVQNVVDVTFPHMANTINDFSKSAARNFGLSETMAKRFSGTFGSMAEAFGFSESQAAEMSTKLTGLAGDVASFYNISQDESYTKLKSVFTGETESLKDLGVVMTQTALDSYALSNGFGKTTQKMEEYEKVSLRLAFVQDKLKNATGDFARTSDSWANQTRILNLQMDSLKANIGQGLINALTPTLKLFNQVLEKVTKLSEKFKDLSEVLFGDAGNKDSGIGNIGNAADNATESVEGTQTALNELKKSVQGFDVIEKLNDSKTDSSTGNTGSSTGGNITGNKPDNSNQQSFGFVDKIKDAINSDNWSDIGDSIASKLNKALGEINLKDLEKPCNSIAKKTATFLNGALSGLDWPKVGEIVADGLNVGFSTANTYFTHFNWTTLGNAINSSLNSFIKNFDFVLAGSTWSNYTKGIQNTLITAIKGTDWSELGSNVAAGINAIDWKGIFSNKATIAAGIINAIVDTTYNFSRDFNWTDFGKAVGNSINTFFRETDFKKLGVTLSNVAIGLLDSICAAIKEVDWSNVGRSLGDMLRNINWGKFLRKTGEVIAEVLKAAIKLAASEVSVNDLSDIEVKLAESVNNMITSSEKLQESFSTSTTKISSQYNSLRGIADVYISLSERYNELTDEQKEMLKEYGEILKKNIDGVEQYIDPITGAYSGTSEQLQKLIDDTERYYLVLASQDALTEASRQLLDLQKTYKEVSKSFGSGGQYATEFSAEQWLEQWNLKMSEYKNTKYENALSALKNSGYVFDLLSEKNKNLINELKNSDEMFSVFFNEAYAKNGYTPINLIALSEEIRQVTDDVNMYTEAINTNGESLMNFNQSTREAGRSTGELATGMNSTKDKVQTAVKNIVTTFNSKMDELKKNALGAGTGAGTGLANGLSNKKNTVSSSITTLSNTVVNGFNALKSKATTSGKNAGTSFADGISGRKSYVGTCANSIANQVKSSWNNFKLGSKDIGAGIGTLFSNGIGSKTAYTKSSANSIANQVKASWNSIKLGSKDIGSNTSTLFSNGIGSKTSYAASCANSIVSYISNRFVNLKNTSSTTGQEVSTKLSDGMRNNQNTPVNTMTGIANNIITGFTSIFKKDTSTNSTLLEWTNGFTSKVKAMLGIHSPSRVFGELGTYVVAGFNNAIVDGESDTKNAMAKWGNAISGVRFKNQAEDVAVSFGNAMNSIIYNFANGINLVTEKMLNLKEIISSISKIDTMAMTPELKSVTGYSSGSTVTGNTNSDNGQIEALLKEIIVLIRNLKLDILLNGESIKDDTVSRINRNTAATGVCEIKI